MSFSGNPREPALRWSGDTKGKTISEFLARRLIAASTVIFVGVFVTRVVVSRKTGASCDNIEGASSRTPIGANAIGRLVRMRIEYRRFARSRLNPQFHMSVHSLAHGD